MRIFFWRVFLATPTRGSKLSMGKLGRATAVGNSDYTSKTSLNDAGRDSGTSKTKVSDFYIGSVDNTLDGYPYVDEQTNETYTMTFTNENSLFQTRIGGRHQNFTWTTSDSDLFQLQSNQDYTAQYNAQAIADATTHTSKSFESNLITDYDFGTWTNDNTLTNWTSSGATVVSKKNVSGLDAGFGVTGTPSGSNNFCIQFDTQDGFISQSFYVDGNSTYQIRALASSSNQSDAQIDMYISGAFHQETYRAIAASESAWYQTRADFYTSGSSGTTQDLMIKFTAVSASETSKPILDTVFFERWEGANFSDTDVTISGKYHDDGQSDGFNDHATRYNTAIQKTVEIQDTYAGQSIACFLPGTMIRLPDGLEKDIEDINVGDDVLSVIIPDLPDEDLGYSAWKSFEAKGTMNNLEVSSAKVKHIFYDYMDGYFSINDGLIKVTAEHDFWTFTGTLWEWCTPQQFSIGDNLLYYKSNMIEIKSVEYIPGEVEVVNIDVEPLDVYFAGGVLVHNKGSSSEP